jgi:hypothetical protein
MRSSASVRQPTVASDRTAGDTRGDRQKGDDEQTVRPSNGLKCQATSDRGATRGPPAGSLGTSTCEYLCCTSIGVWASGTFGRRVMDYRVTSQRLAQLCRAACGSPIKGDPQGDPGRLPTEDSCIVWTRGFLFCRMCFVLRRDDSRERASVANNIIMRASGHGDGRYPGPGHLRGDLGPDHHRFILY